METLAELSPGESGYISSLASGGVSRRLAELGLTPGTKVRVLRRAFFGGPVAVSLRGYELTLRREEAAQAFITRSGAGA